MIGSDFLLQTAKYKVDARSWDVVHGKKMLRSQCVVVVVKLLNVLTTCREIWFGKLKYLIEVGLGCAQHVGSE